MHIISQIKKMKQIYMRYGNELSQDITSFKREIKWSRSTSFANCDILLLFILVVFCSVSVVSFSTLTVLFQRFTQYLASNNCSFNLGQFIDKQGVQGKERERERRERREREICRDTRSIFVLISYRFICYVKFNKLEFENLPV